MLINTIELQRNCRQTITASAFFDSIGQDTGSNSNTSFKMICSDVTGTRLAKQIKNRRSILRITQMSYYKRCLQLWYRQGTLRIRGTLGNSMKRPRADHFSLIYNVVFH